jgi:hypothetical protein
MFNEDLFPTTDNGMFTPIAGPTITILPTVTKILRFDSLQYFGSGGVPPFRWSVSDTSVASVDSITGLFKAKKGGTVLLTAVESQGFDGSINITVHDFLAALPDTSVRVGDSVNVPILIGNVTGLGILSKQIKVQYDTTRIRFVSVVTESTLSTGISVAVKDSASVVRMSFAGATPLAGSGIFAKLRFAHKAPAGPGQNSPLTFLEYTMNEPGPGQPTAMTKNGSVTIQPPPNTPPVFSKTMGDTTINEGQTLTFDYDASDAENDPLKFSLSNQPAGMSIDSISGLLHWTPNFTQQGIYIITVIVSDGKGGSASKQSSITVLKTNQKPVIANPLANTQIGIGNLFAYQFVATDPENDPIFWSANNLPQGAQFSSNGLLQWRPTFMQSGMGFSVTVFAQDGINSVGNTFLLTVVFDNHPPVFSKLFTDTTISEGQQLNFTFTATDDDADTAIYSLQNPSAGMTINPSVGFFTWTPAFTQSGVHTVSVIADDKRGMTTAANLTITVLDVNRPPVFTNVPPDTVNALTGTPLSIQYTAVDADNDVPLFSLFDAPSGATMTQNGLFNWIPAPSQIGTHRAIVRVTDGKVFVNDTAFIRVTEGNTPPRFTAVLADTIISENQELIFTYTATDDQNDSLLFFLLTASAPGATVSPAGQLQWRPDFTQAGSHLIAVSVSDGTFFVIDSAIVTVLNVNRPPQFIVALPDITVPVDTAINFKYAAVDPDNDNITFTLIKNPAGAALQPDGTFSWTPTTAQLGIDTIVVAVSDGSVSVRDTAVITVIGFASAEVSRQVFDFGSISFGGTKTLAATVRNNGIVPLVFTLLPEFNPVPDTNFVIDTAGLSVIPPGAQRTITITYAPKTVGGHYAVFVFITNDPRDPSFVLIANGSAIAKLAVTKRVLVDTLHDSTVPLADSVNGTGQIFSFLEKSGIRFSYPGPVLSPHGNDILLLITPRKNFTRREIDSVKQFVANGGFVIAIGNAGTEGSNAALNSLIADTTWITGLRLNSDLVVDSLSNFSDASEPILTTFADKNHPFLTNVDSLVFFGSASVRISGPAIPFITTSAGGRIAGAATASQPAVVGFSKIGKGKIMLIGDADAWSVGSGDSSRLPNIAQMDNLAFLLNIISVSEEYEVKLPGKTPSEQYRLVSVPFDLDNSDIADVLKDLGGVNPLVWRLFGRFNPSTGRYAEFPSERFRTFKRGEAYWLITRGEFDITFGNTTVVPVQNFYPIRIGPGYSMIGNPFPYRVSWQRSIHDSVENRIWRYDGTSFKAESLALEPFTGYFVKNLTKDTLTIYINPEDITLSTLGKSTASAYGENEWRIGISAAAGKSADEDNFAGVAPGAKEEYDRYDLEEPPTTPTDYVMVRFRNQHWKEQPGSYAMDIRPVSDEGLFWDFDVTTAKTQSRVTLTFSNFGNLPQEFSYYLLDQRTERAIPVSGGSTYEFSMGKSELQRNFRLIAGRNEFIEQNTQGIPLVPLEYSLQQNYPNPFNPSTQIRYTIGNSGFVTLIIYNVLGQRVRTVVNAPQSIGSYSTEWNGRDDRELAVATGVYFYTITVSSHGEQVFTSSKKLILMK